MKFILPFILSLFSVLGFSQTILYQAETTSRTVQDPQAVIMAQGFHAKSDTSDPFIAKLGPATDNPGGGPTDSNAGANNPSGTKEENGKFHDTRGNIEVNGAGQLQFTLPIALPPGVKSVAPQINLVYTSGSGNGIAGYGWSLSGLTSISRTGKTIEKDGEVKGVQLDYSDYYSFNGQRLILKSGEYGKDGAEYVTEKYSNVKIKSVGAITGQEWQGPQYWEVSFEDGSQAWYGSTTEGSYISARTALEYNIVKWKDAQGNYINYSYTQANNVAVVSTIQWGGNEILGKEHFNEIQLNYTARDLKEGSFVNGISFIQQRILTNITVNANGILFKKYAISYLQNGTNYQFLDKITEYNSEGQAANPVTFSYPNFVGSQIDYYGVLPYNNDDFNSIKFTGDFNGDSYLDFVMNNGTVKLGAFNDNFSNISTGKTFADNAKLVNALLDEEGQVYNGNGIVEYSEGKISGYIFRNNAFVKVFEKLVTPNICTNCEVDINEGDINGDGISDVFLTLKNGRFIDRYIIDLKNSNTPVSTYLRNWDLDESSYTDQKYTDIDGDGKVDIINVSNTTYTVFEFVQTAPNQYLKKVKFTGNLLETKDSEFPILFGDFNGDGNLDFTIPTTDTQDTDNWRFYMGTKKGFQNVLKTNFLKYRKPSNPNTWSLMDHHFYSISDINKDGKSDITFIYSKNTVGYVGGNGNAQWRVLQYEVKTMQADGGTNFILGLNTKSPSYNVPGGDYELFQPLTSSIKSNNSYYDIFLFKNTRVHKYKAQSSLAELSRIQSVNQAGVITTIDYKELNPDINPSFYSKTKKEYYPYFSLVRADQTYIVSQLKQEGKKQDFRYRGMTGHMQGKGMTGFYQTARSSWYADGFENTKIWGGAEIDPLNEGLPIKEWSIRTNDESKIFPDNISESNSQLLSFKSTQYQTDKLLNGQVVTTINDADKSRVVTAILPKNTKTKDFLTGTVTESSVTYGAYYLPSQSVSNTNTGYGISTSTFEYIHNPSGIGADYYIGRPKSKIEVVQAYGDTKSAKEEYIYESNLLKTLKTWNRDNTGYLLETNSFDSFGNITQKIINNSVDSQTQTSKTEYDSKGKFVLKKTDNLGLETYIEYNDRGQIKKQTDALGNSLINTYDTWGKLLTSKTNLEGTTTYQYERDSNSNIVITQYDPDGDVSKKYTNKLGQPYKSSTKAFGQGQFISTEARYDVLGRKLKESEPYFEGQTAGEWNIIAYDDSVFPANATATAFNGKKMETSISGFTTTVKELNGYGRTTSKTTDALGNTISTTDKGGTIQFSYNAAGEQIKAQYAENIVSTKYDSWGRKSEFNDPSNGVYKYEYDGFGQPTKNISPKGTKEYTYNNLGQLIAQKEVSTTDGGQATDKKISYSYDDKGRLISKSGTSKGKAYSSNISYDPQGRVLSSSESSNGKYFIQKGITYDDKARVTSYEKQLYSSGILTKVQIENVYSIWNGELAQVKDKNSGKILWELKEANAKGQVLKTQLGSANINNTYDSNGFLTNVNHSSPVKSGILQLSYSFDAIRNELKSRTTGGDFNITESFDYDDNNRLVNWTNPVTGAKPTVNRNVYDVKGRIMENDQVGTMKYENSAKIYQPTGMTLNAAGAQNYSNDLIQTISYNENNDPIFIDGEKGDVAFQYGLTAMRQQVTYGGNFGSDQEGKFTKFYSENGSFEIIKDNSTGKEKHILYIGGTPYESNIVYLKDFTQSSGSYKFLHKDYIGSILAISDEAGNKLEQRHFDAWGNFTHLQIGNGQIITDQAVILSTAKNLIIDRGYTSHEHFMEVGIIHMNGRLYDPLLRRFLNADENIQDPYNTQIYNKYGYAVNNPLIYNDPSGEVLPFLVGIGIGWFAATVLSGAIIGAAISMGIYILQATIYNNFSLGGFAKSILLGAATGAVSAGLGEVFSASGFLSTVANGALTGAGTGGVTALITGQNFLEGVWKGAVIGGAVAGITYSMQSLFYNKSSQGKALSENDLKNKTSYDPSVSNEEMSCNISQTKGKLFKLKDNFGVGEQSLGKSIDGYLDMGDGGKNKFLAYTGKRNFWTGKSDILYSPRIAQDKYLLKFTMLHETGHAYSNMLFLPDMKINIKGLYNDSTEHLALGFLEHDVASINNLTFRPSSFFTGQQTLENTLKLLNNTQFNFFNRAYRALQPIFNRKISFP